MPPVMAAKVSLSPPTEMAMRKEGTETVDAVRADVGVLPVVRVRL